MRSWSMPIGRLLGADFRVHFAFMVLLGYVWWVEAQQGEAYVARGLELAAILLLSVVGHELAHLTVARLRGLAPRAVLLLPIGGVSLMTEGDSSVGAAPRWQREAMIAAAGPLFSGMLAGMAAIWLSTAGQAAWLQEPLISAAGLLRSFFWINAALCALNLLPAYPLDGGRVLRALLSRSMPLPQATRRSALAGIGFSMAMMVAGIWNSWLLLAGMFLFIGVQLEERNARFESVLENVRLEEIMLTDFATLSPADTLQHALAKAVHSLQDDFPVVRGGDMVGTISRQNIVRALRAEGDGYVQAAMNRAYQAAARDESLAMAFRRITAHGGSLVPVVEEERLVGIVTLQNLMHSMALVAEARRLRRQEGGD